MEPLQKIAAPYGARALPLRLDVTDAAMRRNVLAQATEKFGHIDVLANIAGAGAYGAVEEYSSEQIRTNMELNFFAAAELSHEIFPQMRVRKSGHILNLTSIAGLVSFTGCGLYCASKFALEGFTEALHNEVKPLDIRVTLVEPGAFRTDFAGSTIIKASNTIADYAELDAGLETYFHDQNGKQMGDPEKAVAVIIDMVNSETSPVRLMLGEDAYQMWDQTLETRHRDLQTWRQREIDTAYPDAEMNPITL
ncbi:short-chain dehydrogenase/reductase [Acetobacter pomorum]|uniref:Short-chain dehydrogenase/reductase n=1 Tax=Acetobacter pomorum TaxID=65959 RepID=A0A2G4R9L0_9PROT|nr:short-chain dehydrogenase/reductase [Acetobacter pomorum]